MPIQQKEARNEYVSLRVTKKEKESIEAQKDNYGLQLEIIKTIFSSEKNFLQTEMSGLEDELLKYRALLLTVRQEYKKAQDEHCAKLEEFWSEIAKGLPSLKEKVAGIASELTPIIQTLGTVKKELDTVSTYRIKDLMELVSKFQEMNDEGRKMFTYLTENFQSKIKLD